MKDVRSGSNQTMRHLNNTYIHKDGDKLSSIANGVALVESADGTQTQMFAEEFVVKDIRRKILSEANTNESFLGIAGAVALGGVIAITITKAAGAFKRWLQRRKEDKQYKEEQRSNKRAGNNYVEVDDGSRDSFTVNISMNSSNIKQKLSNSRDLPVYRNGKKKTIDEFLRELYSKSNIVDTILIHHRDDGTAVSLYSEDEIKSTYIDYEFTSGTNRYYLLGEDDMRNTLCFCPQDADKLFLLDMEDLEYISNIRGLKKFKISSATLEPGFAMSSIKELKWNEISFYDEALDKDVILMKA